MIWLFIIQKDGKLHSVNSGGLKAANWLNDSFRNFLAACRTSSEALFSFCSESDTNSPCFPLLVPLLYTPEIFFMLLISKSSNSRPNILGIIFSHRMSGSCWYSTGIAISLRFFTAASVRCARCAAQYSAGSRRRAFGLPCRCAISSMSRGGCLLDLVQMACCCEASFDTNQNKRVR